VDWKTAATILVTIAVAVAGYANTLRLQRRKDRLDRLNRQLKDLYGPLLAATSASERIWQVFRQKNQTSGGFWEGSSSERPQDTTDWQIWMISVFMPLNERMVEAITLGTDLIDEPKMPSCFLDLCAHVGAYRPVLAKWKNGDFTERASVIPFPEEVHEHVKESFQRLKTEQATLLGSQRRRWRRSATQASAS
jgi:hypothetical protein